MSTQIEKVAHGLAVRAVERKYMGKQAQGEAGFKLPRAAQTALIGSVLGGAGTGLISAISGRRRGDLVRDLLLGALVGGAGGAAYPYVTGTARGIGRKISGPALTPVQRSEAQQKAVAEAIQGGGPGARTGATAARDVLLGVRRGVYGPGSGADILSYALPATAGVATTALMRQAELGDKGLPKKLLPPSFAKRFPRLSRGLRAGAVVRPSSRSLKGGLIVAALTALAERLARMPTPQGAAQ